MIIALKDIKVPPEFKLMDEEATIQVGDSVTDKVIQNLVKEGMDKDEQIEALTKAITVMHFDPDYDWESVKDSVTLIRWGLDGLFDFRGEDRFKEIVGEETYKLYMKVKELEDDTTNVRNNKQ